MGFPLACVPDAFNSLNEVTTRLPRPYPYKFTGFLADAPKITQIDTSLDYGTAHRAHGGPTALGLERTTDRVARSRSGTHHIWR